MHAYIIGLGKAWGAGTGRVGEGGEGGVVALTEFTGNIHKETQCEDHRQLPQIHQGFPSDMFHIVT